MNFNHEKFFIGYKREFDPTLNKQQVNALEFLLTSFENEPAWNDLRHIAYAFATTHIETFIPRTGQRYEPVTEVGDDVYFNKYNGRKDLGNNQKGDGLKFKGRGFVQITGRKNYTKFSKLLGIDLVENPKLALDPENAFQIMTIGMHKGIFTGKKLSSYINYVKKDYKEARRIINGQDRAGEIARLAEAFEDILRESLDKKDELSNDSKTEDSVEAQPQVLVEDGANADIHTEAPKPTVPSDEKVELKKERPSLRTTIGAAFTFLTGLGINAGTLFQSKLEQLTPIHIVYLGAALGLIALAIWWYNKSADRANKLNQQNSAQAADQTKYTVQFKG